MPRVSIIVPVRNEAKHIRRTLVGLIRQAFALAEYEILVVDGHSDDETVSIVREVQETAPNVQLLFNPLRLSSAARNVAVRQATGDYLVVVDGHCELHDRNYLSKLVEAFETSGADCLGRPQPLRTEQPTPFQRAVGAARQSWLGHNPDSSIFSDRAGFVNPDNVAVAYRREVFATIGGFDESFDACEDVDFNSRTRQAGFTCFFTPTIAVDYQPRATLRGLMHQLSRYGRGRARLARKYPSTITPASLIPPLWLAWLICGTVASVFWTPAAFAVLASILCYLCVVGAESLRLWRAKPEVSFARLPLIFAAIHLGFGLGYWREILAGRRAIPVPVCQMPPQHTTPTVISRAA